MRHDDAVVGDAASHPDRGVGAERADLEHPPSAGDAGEQMQQLARDRRDLDRRKARGVLLGDRRLEVGIMSDERFGQVGVERGATRPEWVRS